MKDKPPSDSELYTPLINIAKQREEEIKEINQKTLNIFQDAEFLDNIRKIYGTISDSILPYEKIRESSRAMADSLLQIEQQYKRIISSIDFHQFSESVYNALERIHTITLYTLSQHCKTTMIEELTKCFSQANYEALSLIINQCMEKPTIQASDIAFIKYAKIIPVLGDQLKYPHGIKTSIRNLNVITAREIADNNELVYNTKTNLFVSEGTDINSKELNVISAGKTVFCYITGDNEFITERELISLMGELAEQYAVGILHEAGNKLYTWINEQFHNKAFCGFDREFYYHSRPRNKEEIAYVPDQMTRAPYGKPAAGRYNLTGVAHYYFSDTQDGAETEVKKHIDLDNTVIQTAKLKPIKSIRLLDLSGTIQRGASLMNAIRCHVIDKTCKMPREYLIPCFIADCCKKIGFDGIKYYGSKEYSNYVSWNDGFFSFVCMC